MIVKNARCALPGFERLVKRDLRIVGEKIAKIADGIEPEAEEGVIDADGLELYPGAIDPHVHFNEPGLTHREDFHHGSMASARGGVTTVIDMPSTSIPPPITLETLKQKLQAIGHRSVVDFALFAGISGHRIEQAIGIDMEAMAPYVLGFKCRTLTSADTFTAVDHYGFSRAVALAATLKRPILLHAEDPGIVYPATKAMKEKAQAEDRDSSWDDYVASRPELAEIAAAASAIALSRGSEHALHIMHVGTAEAAELIASGGASCETCPHYLAFSAEDFAEKGSSLKTAPVVKARGQAERLWKLLADGTISFVASDHAPAPPKEKHTASVWTDYGGIPGTGTLFPYLYSEGYKAGRLSLPAFLRATSGAAAARYGLSAGKGSLETGKDADFVLVDPEGEYLVKGEELLSKGTITPFEGMRLKGAIRATYVRGRPVWEAGLGITAPIGYGKHLCWGYR